MNEDNWSKELRDAYFAWMDATGTLTENISQMDEAMKKAVIATCETLISKVSE